MRKRGVVAALPTIITDDVDQMLKRVSKYASLMESNPDLASQFPGLHIEGPFISPNEDPRGAHPKAHCRHPEELPRFLENLRYESGNRISLISLAPELRGVIELIEESTSANICVGIGHTDAGFEIISEASQGRSTNVNTPRECLTPVVTQACQFYSNSACDG